MEPEKPHLSPSQMEMYCKCGEQYRRRYIEREKIPPGVSAHRGRGMHAGAQVNFRQKQDSHRDLPIKDIVDASVAAFEAEVAKDGFSMTAEEQARGANALVAEAKDDTARFAEFHGRNQAPDYQPIVVEKRVRIVLPNASHDLLGVLDLMDSHKRIVDFKTGARRKPEGEADASVQLTTYAAAAAVYGMPASEVRLDIMVGQKRQMVRQIQSSTRGPTDFVALSNRINMVLAGIGAGIFPPATPGSWWCSPKWCGYWRSCPYVNSERQALQQIGGGE